MPITQAQIAVAEAAQHAAARDPAMQVRLLAGPGTGKSNSIVERVRWLEASGQPPASIAAVSFTRASAKDLEERIHLYGIHQGLSALTQVRVSTLHALALGILRRAGLLQRYPTDPIVMDNWELRQVLDAEFGGFANIAGVARPEEVRLDYEAYCSTGVWGPPGQRVVDPPITQAERDSFGAFLPVRAQTYSCVLPGELIKKCVEEAAAGTIDLVGLAGFEHLIVDEYQDLNPVDLEFVDRLAHGGVTLFVAGDDDQSVYAFRHAAPVGIQQFQARYPNASLHTLDHCFRCTPEVLDGAYRAVAAFPDPNRLPKAVTSLHAGAIPPEQGFVHRWRFGGSRLEATAIAESCRDLIAAGVPANDIMVLLSSTPALSRGLVDALTAAGVPCEEPRPEPFVDTLPGRCVLCILRIVGNHDDLIAARTLLGLQRGVGIATCNRIVDGVVTTNLSFADLLSPPLPQNVFQGRAAAALTGLHGLLASLAGWDIRDNLGAHRAEISDFVEAVVGAQARAEWIAEAAVLPDGATLGEVRDYISTAEEGRRELVLGNINARLGIHPPPTIRPSRVRIMTMHGSKGLSAKVVFIPGLEEGLMPSRRNAPFPGLVAESARLLFVSMSRARAACVLSFAVRRGVHGQSQQQTASRFAASLGAWAPRNGGLTHPETRSIVTTIGNL